MRGTRRAGQQQRAGQHGEKTPRPDAVIEAVSSGKHRFIRVNFAGGDMVGHTGAFPAARMAIESLDIALARILPVVAAAKGCLVVTADHGNADDMVERAKDGTPLVDERGRPHWRTSHSLNPVPAYVYDASGASKVRLAQVEKPGIANLAATCITLLGYEPPADYTPSIVEVG